ncbi:phage tail assembly chaperone [bacterium]|nr:phage tail assembly chaperone [bacterium]
MEVYSYDKQSGIFVGTTVADEDPKRPGNYLFPAQTTSIKPPTIDEDKLAKWNNNAWVLVDKPPRELTQEEKDKRDYVAPSAMELLRMERNSRLNAVEWMVSRDITTLGTVSDNLKIYMQQLRDLPENSNPRVIVVDDPYVELDMESVQWPFLNV